MVSRAEHRRATLLNLSNAATEVFEARGDDATIEEIATAAGVSRRTVYRWVDQRDDLIFIHPRLWIDVFDAAVAGMDSEPVAVRIRAGAAAVSDSIDNDPTPVRRAMLVALAHPPLMRGYATVSQAWVDRMASEVLSGATDGESVFRSRVLGAAIMGVIDAALNAWLASDPPVELGGLVDAGLDYLNPILLDH